MSAGPVKTPSTNVKRCFGAAPIPRMSYQGSDIRDEDPRSALRLSSARRAMDGYGVSGLRSTLSPRLLAPCRQGAFDGSRQCGRDELPE